MTEHWKLRRLEVCQRHAARFEEEKGAFSVGSSFAMNRGSNTSTPNLNKQHGVAEERGGSPSEGQGSAVSCQLARTFNCIFDRRGVLFFDFFPWPTYNQCSLLLRSVEKGDRCISPQKMRPFDSRCHPSRQRQAPYCSSNGFQTTGNALVSTRSSSLQSGPFALRFQFV